MQENKHLCTLISILEGNDRIAKDTTKKPPQPRSSINTLVDLADMIDQPEDVHKINTIFNTFILICTTTCSTRVGFRVR